MGSSANNPNLTPIDLTVHQRASTRKPSFWSGLGWRDGVFAVLMIALFAYGGLKNRDLMDVYEEVILVFSVLSIVFLGWFWRPLQWMFAAVAGKSKQDGAQDHRKKHARQTEQQGCRARHATFGLSDRGQGGQGQQQQGGAMTGRGQGHAGVRPRVAGGKHRSPAR